MRNAFPCPNPFSTIYISAILAQVRFNHVAVCHSPGTPGPTIVFDTFVLLNFDSKIAAPKMGSQNYLGYILAPNNVWAGGNARHYVQLDY